MQVHVDTVSEQPWCGPRIALAVAGATLKGNRSDWLVEKAVELGAFAFIPLLTHRSPQMSGTLPHVQQQALACAASSPELERQIADRGLDALLPSIDLQAGTADSAGRIARWQRVVAAATEQSLRVHATQLCSAVTAGDIAQLACASSARVLVASQGGQPCMAAVNEALESSMCAREPVVAGAASASGHVDLVLVIGPEGDFTPNELSMLDGAGAQLIGLGKQRLRTETAAIATLSAAMLCGASG